MTTCNVCSATTVNENYHSNVLSVYTDKAYQLAYCSTCKSISTFPLPTDAELTDIYQNKYSYDVHFLIEQEKRFRAREYARLIQQQPNVKTFLEIGCMYGFLLEELKKTTLDASGIEIDPKAVAHSQQQGLNVKESNLEAFLDAPHSKYDMIFMSHVLEHIVHPMEQFKKVREVLNPGGQLMIIVPNAGSFSARLFGKFWGYWQVPVHITHFTEASLRYVVEQNGFRVKSVKTRGGDSLLFLSTLANLMNARSTDIQLSPLKKSIIRLYSTIAKYWYYIGGEDLIMIAEKKDN